MDAKVVDSVIDGVLHYSYFVDDHPVLHAELQGVKADQTKKNQFAIKELELVVGFLDRILGVMEKALADQVEQGGDSHITPSEEDSQIVQALFSAATVAYGKLFMGTGVGRRSFSAKDFFHGEGARFKELHEWWMEIRHQYIAHSVSDDYDDARLVALFSFPSTGSSEFIRCVPHVRFRRIPSGEDIEQLLEMCDFVLADMLARQQKLLDSIDGGLTQIEKEECRERLLHSWPAKIWPSAPAIDGPLVRLKNA